VVVGVRVADAVDERAVDLERVDGEVAQVGERREAGTEVVEREVRAERLDLVQARDGRLEVLHELGLCDLEDQAAGRDAGVPRALEDVLGQPGREQLGAREVDADDHVRRVQPHPQPR
jgi:hypothetical protein